MDKRQFDQILVTLINQARKDKGISLNALAVSAGIPYSTLYRKVEKGSGSLLANEVHSIADALNINDRQIWPSTVTA